MKNEKESTKEKILFASLEFIEKNGINAITVRKIAEIADVNVAAINYHFGSKEELLQKALEFSMYQAYRDPIIAIKEKKFNVYQALHFLLHDWFEGMINYPGISRAQLFEPFVNNNYESLFVKKFNTFLEDFITKLKENGEVFDEQDLRLSLVQIISAIILPGIMPQLFSNFFKKDLKIMENREEYFNHLLSKYVKEI
ncbi:MAG: TetR/AcrR family transcriptional regulator [bacterium]